MRFTFFHLMIGSALTSAVLLATACAAPSQPSSSGSGDTEATTKGPSGTLDVGVASDIISGDFHLAVGGGNWPLTSFVPEGLTGRNPITNEIVGHLATSWKYLDNGKAWEFKLRQGIQFHNGEPFNAASVKYSWDRLMNPATKATQRVAVAPFYDHLEVVDDYTVRFVLKEPNSVGATTVGGQLMFPPKYTESAGAEGFAKQPVGTGVYKFVERKPGEVIVLEANENYWNKDPNVGPTPSHFKTIRQRIIPEDQTRLAALQTNEIGLMVNLPEPSVKRIESSKNLKVQYRSSGGGLNWIVLNSAFETDPKTGKPNPMRDRRVRQAMNYAVDVDTIIKKLRTGKEHRSNGAGEGTANYDPSLKPYPYDPAKAKSLLAEAGYSSGFEQTLFDPTGRWPASKEVLDATAGYLTAVGIKTTVQSAEYAAVASSLDNKTMYGMAIWGAPGSVDGLGPITLSYRKSPNSRRSIYIGNDRVEALADQVYQEFDPEKQAAILKQLTRAWFEDAGELFLYDQWYLYAFNGDLLSWDEKGPPYSSTSGQAPYYELKPVNR